MVEKSRYSNLDIMKAIIELKKDVEFMWKNTKAMADNNIL